MDIRDFVRLVRRNWLLLIPLTVAGLIVALAYTGLQTPLYSATAKAYVATRTAANVNDLSQGSDFLQQEVKTYADIATTPYVLDEVIKDVGLHTTWVELAKRVDATAVTDEAMVMVQVRDPSPARASKIADRVTTRLAAAVTKLTPSGGSKAAPAVKVTQIQPALSSEKPVSPNLPLNAALGLIVGLALGLGTALLRERLDTRMRSAADVEQVTERPVLGRIVFDRDQRPLDSRAQAWSPRAEAFRALRTNLEFLDIDEGPQVIVVTSSLESEGKTTTAANLAVTLAEAGEKVLLVDADLRKPRVAEYLGIDGAVGLTDVLIRRAGFDEAVQDWGSNQLAVLPAGRPAPNPSELLQSRAMIDLLEAARQRFSIVLLDTPPLLPVTDGAILTRRANGALVVVAAKRARRADLRAALDTLAQVNARVLGIVLTKVPRSGPDADAAARRYSTYGVPPSGTASGRSRKRLGAARSVESS